MIRLVLGLVVWAAAAYGVLMLHQLPGDLTHDLCGPWGCFPPVQALLAMHALWVLLLAPPVVWAAWRLPARRLRFAGKLLLALSLAVLLGVVGHEYTQWYQHTPEEFRKYFPHRVGYAVATLSDVPAVQGVIAGAALLVIGRRKDGGK